MTFLIAISWIKTGQKVYLDSFFVAVVLLQSYIILYSALHLRCSYNCVCGSADVNHPGSICMCVIMLFHNKIVHVASVLG